MKASLQWMNTLAANVPINKQDIVERIGAQLGEVEDVSDLSAIYSSALVVNVVKAEPLEGSDHLSVCLVDDGGAQQDAERNADKLVQVVCGASNVRSGLKAIWLPPGSTVPASFAKDPFVLSARKIMGTVSNGMLASARELAIGEDHEGIVELEASAVPGTRLTELLKLDDVVIDIENKMFTHRPDLFGQLGVARELCGIYGQAFSSPEWYREDRKIDGSDKLRLTVDNRLKENACPRFMVVAIDGLEIGPSPLWLQSYLARTGIRPINNIVDVTNYVMMVTGQPLHAYDLTKLQSGDSIDMVVRHPESGEQLTLLDGSSIKLNSTDIVIADKTKALGLGGIMGGRESEVSTETTSILLECASFDMFTIRRSSMAHGIFSEAVTRFTKGQSPRQCQSVLAYAIDLLKQLCTSANIASNIVDEGRVVESTKPVELQLPLLETYLGMSIEPKKVVDILNNVELKTELEGATLKVTSPFWRTDIQAAEDIIEEVARLIGFSQLPVRLPLRNLEPSLVPVETSLNNHIREVLASGGANEILSYSFIDEKLMKQTAQPIERSFKLANALSPELQYYRTAIMPSLLKSVHLNHKNGYGRLALFEIGMVHFADLLDQDALPMEPKRLAVVVSAETKAAKASYEGAAFYQARVFLDYLFKGLGVSSEGLRFVGLTELNNSDVWNSARGSYYDGRSAAIKIGNEILGAIGEFNSSLSRSLKLPEFCAGFEIDLSLLASLYLKKVSPYRQLSRFPSVWQDLTVTKPLDVTYQQVMDELMSKLASIQKEDIQAELKLIDIYEGDGTDARNWTFRLKADSYQRTLTDQEISTLVNNLKS